jgi:hypothetical protein
VSGPHPHSEAVPNFLGMVALFLSKNEEKTRGQDKYAPIEWLGFNCFEGARAEILRKKFGGENARDIQPSPYLQSCPKPLRSATF